MKKKKYRPKFTLDEIGQLLDWEKGEFTSAGRLHDKLLRIRRKLIKEKLERQGEDCGSKMQNL